MKIKKGLEIAVQCLRAAGIPSPRLDAEVLLMTLLKKDRAFLYTHPEFEYDERVHKRFLSQIQERVKYKPLAYITRHKEFLGIDFYVDENVLIPRPDTECVVETALERLREVKNPSVLDLGTGSGAIGLSIKSYRPDAFVTLSDVSKRALQVAERNSVKLGYRVECIQSDLFVNLTGRYDLIVSNPPYIIRDEINTLEEDIRVWEPRIALDGGEDGFYFYERILREAPFYLEKKGSLILESGDAQGEELIERFNKYGYKNVGYSLDLSGTKRAVYGDSVHIVS